MTDTILIQGQAGRRALSGSNAPGWARLGPGSELVGLPWHVATAMEGRVFVANFGSATTPLNFAKTAYDEDQPQFVVRVPANVVIVPLSIAVQLEDSAGTDNEVIFGTAQNDIGDGSSSAATIGPRTAHTANGRASSCTPRQLYTGNSTALTNMLEFFRATYPFADATTDPVKRFVWDYLQSGLVPVLKGPASLIGWIAGATTAPAGFATVAWAEFDAADLDAA